MFLQASVILSTGGSASVHAGIPPPQEQTPPPPYEQTPQPPNPHMSRLPPGAGTPLPSAKHAGRYGQRTGGTHPTGMQTCFVSFYKGENVGPCCRPPQWRIQFNNVSRFIACNIAQYNTLGKTFLNSS